MDEYEYLKANSRCLHKAKDGEYEIWITPKNATENLIVPLVTIVITKDGKREYHTKQNMFTQDLYDLIEFIDRCETT